MFTPETTYQVRVWDLPTRLFHWLLVVTFVMIWLTQGDSRYLNIHVFAGYAFLGLLGFRLFWGFWGSHHACFYNFPVSGSAVLNYLKHLRTSQCLGHNPLGSWAILAILGLGLVVSLTGMLTLGGENRHGPLAGTLDFAMGEQVHKFHTITAWLMLGLVGIHIAGVIMASWLHRENLIKAMITGFKTTTHDYVSVSLHGLTASVLVLVGLIGSGGYFSGYLIKGKQAYLPFVGPQLPDNARWRKICGECHLAYHPTLLPIRSWQTMMDEQHQHFEEDLDLDEETVKKITHFLVTNAAETALTKTAWKMDQTIPLEQSPQRITETAYWLARHQSLDKAVWQRPTVNSKANCSACHLDAHLGTFEAAAMYLPKTQ